MKKHIFLEILKKINSDPGLRRKAVVALFAGFFAIVLVGGLTIWAGVSAIKYVASSAGEIVKSPITQDKIQSVKAEIQKLEFQPLDCWGKAQSLLTARPWIENPMVNNLRDLKVACLDPQPSICKGEGCEQIKRLLNTADGSTL